MHRQLASVLGLLSALLSVGTEVRAGNLLRNPGFNVDIAGWDIGGNCFAPEWDSFGPGFTDGALAMNCGSSSMTGKVRQCLPIHPTDVDFSAEVSDNGAPGPVAFGILGYATTDCTGAAAILLDPAGTSVVPDGACCGTTWTSFSRANMSLPVSTRSVMVEITVTTPADIALDNIQLGPSIYQNGFEIEN